MRSAAVVHNEKKKMARQSVSQRPHKRARDAPCSASAYTTATRTHAHARHTSSADIRRRQRTQGGRTYIACARRTGAGRRRGRRRGGSRCRTPAAVGRRRRPSRGGASTLCPRCLGAAAGATRSNCGGGLSAARGCGKRGRAWGCSRNVVDMCFLSQAAMRRAVVGQRRYQVKRGRGAGGTAYRGYRRRSSRSAPG